MTDTLKEMLKSKKFIAAMAGVLAVVVVTVLGQLGIAISEQKVLEVILLVSSYVVGQGMADFGKSSKLLK